MSVVSENIAVFRVLLADDHAVLREGMRNILERDKEITVVGEARDGEEAVKLAAELKPDVVIMDIVMPGLNGIEATKKIKQENPAVNVLILTAYSDIRYILGLLEAGACGYLLKSAHGTEITNAIHAVKSGESVLDPVVTKKLIERLIGNGKGSGKSEGKEALSQREIEVLKLAAKGLSNVEIAGEIFVTERTVKAHFTNIFNKMGVGSRTDAIVRGLKEGYIVLDDINS
jgi:NarL family two-component system response regulator LiaR